MINDDDAKQFSALVTARLVEIEAETAERISRAAADVAKTDVENAVKDTAFLDSYFSSRKTCSIIFDMRDDRSTMILRRWSLLVADPRRFGKTVDVHLMNFGFDEISNSDLDVFANVGSITLCNLPSITDISALRNVEVVTLKKMPHVVAATKPLLALKAFERDVSNATAAAESQAYVEVSSATAAVSAQAHISNAEVADEKWLESVFDGMMPSVFFDNTRSSERRFKMLIADTRRVDKRHVVHIENVEQITNKDLAVFANARKVEIYNTSSITDVSALCSVDEVILFKLSEITDVSPLRSVRIVSLKSLPKISDVSALRGVDTLRVEYMPLVTDVSALRGVRDLVLGMLPLVSDVSALRGVYNLMLYGMINVSNVSALCEVPKLCVHRCKCKDVSHR